jgi:purine-binding chemotaxis protein CheW
MTMSQTRQARTGQANLLATFAIRNANCAIDAAGVQEVIRLGALTEVRRAPREVLGIVNLRGRLVTILDPGLILGLERAIPGPDSRVFIIEDRNEFIGLLVDRVGEVVEVDPEQIEPPPANVGAAQSRFFKGVHRVGSHVITLVDIDLVLSADGS